MATGHSLTFSKSAGNNVYTATATPTGDFNIHLETDGKQTDNIEVLSSTTSSGKGEVVFSKYFNGVVDHDFEAKIYPKYITINCNRQPTGTITY